MNLIHDPIVTIERYPIAPVDPDSVGRHARQAKQARGEPDSRHGSLSLAELLAAMTRGEVQGFPALRAHQRPAWHMFLAQLGALAAWTAGHDELPEEGTQWMQALRTLTPDDTDDESWHLIPTDDAKPAFLQPPKPTGPGSETLKWSRVTTPDALDLLITSKGHDLKRETARRATPEDWMFALVSLQTSEGYGGKGHQGIARMNGGSSSRPMLGLVPTQDKHITVDPSAWWRRDVQRLIAMRRAGHAAHENAPGRTGAPALLWRLDWPEDDQLDIRDLDPWFIEICRRIRLVNEDGKISAQRSTSKVARIDAKAFKGFVGDPWAPVHVVEGKSLTLSPKGYHYRTLCDLLFSGNWKRPPLAEPRADETANMLLLAEGLSRGNVKTEGFHSRTVPLPRKPKWFSSDSSDSSDHAMTLSKRQMEEIEKFDKALRNALSLIAAHGDWEIRKKEHFAATNPARNRFDQTADRLFFPSLWRRVEAAVEGDPKAIKTTRKSFLSDLRRAAECEFETALPAIACPAIHRPRAETRGRRIFHGAIRKQHPELFEKENTDADT